LTDETNTNAAVVIPEDVGGTNGTITKVSSATSSSNHHYSPFPTLYNRKSQSRSISVGDEASLEGERSVLSFINNDNTIDSRDDTTVEDEMNKSRSVSFADDSSYSSSTSGEEQSHRDDNDTIDFPTKQTAVQHTNNNDDESDDDYGTSSFCSCGTIDQVEDVNLKVNTFSTRNVAHHERVVESVVSSENDDDDNTCSTDGSDSSSTCSGTIDGATLDGTIDDGTVDDGTVDDGTVDDGTVGDGTLDDGTVLSYVSNQVDKERAKNKNGGLGWFSWLVCADGLENDVVTNNTSVPPTDDDDDDATYDSTPNVSNNPASEMVDEEKTSMKQITPIKFDEQPPSVSLRRVPSLSKTLGLLKKSGSYDKSIASDGASTTTSKKKLKRMFKSKEKSPKGVKSPKDKSLNITNNVPPPKNEPTVDVYNKPSDSDNKLYRDLICMNHGGIENLVVRECSKIPRLNGTDHLLIKVEVREFIGSSREVYFLRNTF
jgi:hypothetical protein